VAYDHLNADQYKLGSGAVHRPCCANCEYSVRVKREPIGAIRAWHTQALSDDLHVSVGGGAGVTRIIFI